MWNIQKYEAYHHFLLTIIKTNHFDKKKISALVEAVTEKDTSYIWAINDSVPWVYVRH